MSSNEDENNKSSKKIDLTASAAKERTRYREERLLNEFAFWIHSSANVQQICDHFQIARKTYYRWMRKVASRERRFMTRHYDDILTNEVTATANQFNHIVSVMNNIMNSDEYDAAERIDAAKLSGEVKLALLTLYGRGATAAWAALPNPVRKVITDEYATVRPEKPVLIEVKASSNDEQQIRTEKEEQGPRDGST